MEIHLTGSRFFGYNRPDSDWDYFTQYSRALEDVLELEGYAFKGSGITGSRVWTKGNVDLILVKDVAFYLNLRDSLKGQLTRENRARVWREAVNNAQNEVHVR